jgi:hypothetical protein
MVPECVGRDKRLRTILFWSFLPFPKPAGKKKQKVKKNNLWEI